MDVIVTHEGECVILALSGRMDATNAVQFDNAAQAAVNEGHTRFLIDMKELVYISSAGLRSLLGLAKKTRAAQGKLCFCCLQPMVAEVFHISGFDRILSVCDDRGAGLALLL